MYVAHRRLNVIVSGDILQRKGVRVLSSLGQKGMTQSVQAGIGMGLDLFPYLAYLFLQHPRLQRFCRIVGVREDIVAPGIFQKPFEYFLHFVINHQLAFSRPPFQTALDYPLSADFPIRTLLRVEGEHNPSSALASRYDRYRSAAPEWKPIAKVRRNAKSIVHTPPR